MNAAQAISTALDDYGMTKRKNQAELLGEYQSAWSHAIAGRDPHVSKVWGWLVEAMAHGVAISVTFGHDGCSAVVASDTEGGR